MSKENIPVPIAHPYLDRQNHQGDLLLRVPDLVQLHGRCRMNLIPMPSHQNSKMPERNITSVNIAPKKSSFWFISPMPSIILNIIFREVLYIIDIKFLD